MRVDIKNLPCVVMSTVTNDDYLVKNKHLPGDRIGVLVGEDNYDHEIIDYVNMTNNTKGDFTTTNVDRSCLLYTSRCV